MHGWPVRERRRAASRALVAALFVLAADPAGAQGRMGGDHGDAEEGLAAAAIAACGRREVALDRAAARLARAEARSGRPPTPGELVLAVRDAGSPHVRPRAFTLASPDAEPGVGGRVRAWAERRPAQGERRCGAAVAGGGGRTVLAVVAVDALAVPLDPVRRARPGQWTTLRASLLVEAFDAKVVLLGPRGLPRTVPTSRTGRDVRASFAVDRRGTWLVQLLVDAGAGPMPALEVELVAGDDGTERAIAAPGEDVPAARDDDAGTVLGMINAARASEGLAPLRRAEELAAEAAAHAGAMLARGVVGHDVGAGDPVARLEAAGLEGHATGENVARAASLPLAHRALWASPSHRRNLLDARFRRAGVGVARDPRGDVWVAILFAP